MISALITLHPVERHRMDSINLDEQRFVDLLSRLIGEVLVLVCPVPPTGLTTYPARTGLGDTDQQQHSFSHTEYPARGVRLMFSLSRVRQGRVWRRSKGKQSGSSVCLCCVRARNLPGADATWTWSLPTRRPGTLASGRAGCKAVPNRQGQNLTHEDLAPQGVVVVGPGCLAVARGGQTDRVRAQQMRVGLGRAGQSGCSGWGVDP
ncbi:hypothetical protein HaLaN_20458 [Haematococcus lacustris]|uniref:Uncharacterized protein n=1 Tax=Haematococcus lacustris TaxID=44745 RepID=A0A6A0A1K8_HAELA|nr:hypothetical protein HaLaN_20458 [Haematococcus lacustris]